MAYVNYKDLKPLFDAQQKIIDNHLRKSLLSNPDAIQPEDVFNKRVVSVGISNDDRDTLVIDILVLLQGLTVADASTVLTRANDFLSSHSHVGLILAESQPNETELTVNEVANTIKKHLNDVLEHPELHQL